MDLRFPYRLLSLAHVVSDHRSDCRVDLVVLIARIFSQPRALVIDLQRRVREMAYQSRVAVVRDLPVHHRLIERGRRR